MPQKPWTTLEPDGEMLETELYEHCQIHLAYIGKHQYATLHRKPFSVANAPPSLRSMLEPMKLKKTTKRSCQQEALDLSLHKPTESTCEVEQGDALQGTSNDSISEHNQSVNVLGNNEPTIGTPVIFDDLPAPKISPERQRYLDALESIRKTWTEVKLLKMKSSVVDFYLQKETAPKGDNIVPNLTKSPIHLSRAGRPIRTCSTSRVPTFLD